MQAAECWFKCVESRDAPLIDIVWLVRCYWLIVVYTIGKYKLLFLLSKVNKRQSGFRFR